MSTAIESFGKYILLEKLAAGGMAEVYLAKTTGASGVSKFLAVKRILPQFSDNPEFVEMFKEEAKIAVNLNHSNVVSIFDFGIEKRQFFLVMEYVEGQNLRQVINHLKKENKYFSIDQIVYMIKEVAGGLDHAHRCIDGTTGRPLNITHRDMSPQNIMVSFEGEVKVVDFGIAKAETQLEQTRAGTIKGKFGYMSPEQADGQQVDLRTDVFSLGIVLWELLANDRLFTANSEAATLKKIRECQIPPVRKLNPAVPPELERICNKALAKDKSLRYQTAAAFHKDLSRFLNTQYPEFSAHDFSVFMKSAFSQMFLDNRKKLVEYAKVQSVSDATMVTATATMTNTVTNQEENSINFNIDGKEVNITAKPGQEAVDLDALKTRSKAVKLTPLRQTQAINNSGIIPNVQTQSRIRAQTQASYNQKRSFIPSAPTLLFFIVLGLGGYVGLEVFVNKKTPAQILATVMGRKPATPFAQQPQPSPTPEVAQRPTPVTKPAPTPEPMGVAESASKEMYIMTVESQPSGARIMMDGQDVGMITPARLQIEAQKEFRIGFRKDGFNTYERTERATRNGYSVKATLQPMIDVGYLSIEVINGGTDPVLTLNGVRLEEKPPINLMAVPAGKPLKIQAHNPFMNLRAEQTIQVGVGQKQKLQLILGRAASK